MAVYHLSVKTISRSAGRSATAAAAYRTGAAILDERTGEVHDYTRKAGVFHSEIVLPSEAPEWASNSSALWNAAEQAETRKNSTVAREFVIALPAELGAGGRNRLAADFAREIAERHRCAVQLAVHRPDKQGDNRNWHAHILCSTRRLGSEGFTEKTRELDDQKSGEVVRWRERWAALQNEHLAARGSAERVDHRSLADQGIERKPTSHLGPAATAIVRRGQSSLVLERIAAETADRLRQARVAGAIERESQQLDAAIIDTSAELHAALQERDRQRQAKQPPTPPPRSPVEAPRAPETVSEYLDHVRAERSAESARLASVGHPYVGPLLDRPLLDGKAHGLIDSGRRALVLIPGDFSDLALGARIGGTLLQTGFQRDKKMLEHATGLKRFGLGR